MSERPDAQNRLADAPATADARRDRLSVLAEQQTALRRVATLVARGASPSEVFAGVAEEMANCLKADNAGVLRYEADGALTVVSTYFEPPFEEASILGSYAALG